MQTDTTTADMEAGLIGSVLLKPDTLDAISESVAVYGSDFADESLGAAWDVVAELYEAGKPIGIPQMITKLRKVAPDVKWPARLAACLDAVPNAAHGRYYASHVKQASQRRQLQAIGRETAILATSDDEPEATASTAIDRLESIASPPASAVSRPADWIADWQALLAARTSGRETAMRTGFAALNELLAGGLREGELMVIAGRPACGKTAMAAALAAEMSKDRPVLFVSLEMSQLELADRMLAMESGVHLHRMKTGTISQGDREDLTQAAGMLAGRGLSIIDGEYNLGRITALARQWRRREGIPGVVVVDYLQLVETDYRKGQARHEVVGEISRKLKQLAKTLGGPVIALSQLNRQADGERPRLSHLRESGSIEQDANQVLMLWEVDAKDGGEGRDKLIRGCLEKNRNGATGEIPLVFRRERVLMSEAAPERLAEFDEFNGQDSGEFY